MRHGELLAAISDIDPVEVKGDFERHSVRWTDHALDKAQQLSFARRDVESALLDGHRKRRRNKGRAAWQVVAGRIVIAYEHPDGDDPLVARIVTIWRELPADFLRMLPPPQIHVAA